jgi:NADPH2:quinone reductase
MSMRAVLVSEFGDPGVLRVVERDDPVLRDGEVLVRIRATAVNPSDISARLGQTHQRIPGMPMPFTPGWDLAGTIVTVGDGDTDLRSGDRVLGMIPWAPIRARTGAYAELAAVEPGWLTRTPDELDDERAAALPLSGLTALQGLNLLHLPSRARVLITGAGGAVGGMAVQLAVAAGHRVVAVAGRDDEEWVDSLGATEVLSRDADLSGLGALDGVFDAVPVGPRSAAALRPGGRAVFTRPPAEEPPAGIAFETVFVEPDPLALAGLARRVAAGDLRIRIAQTFPLSDASRAHARMDAGGVKGKLILKP